MDSIAPEAIARRFAIGRCCFVAEVDGVIASYGWVTHGSEYVGEFERLLLAEPGEAYIWDCATLPDYRRLGLFSALLAHMTANLTQAGVHRLWIIGLAAAPGIDRGVAAAGFKPIFGLTYRRLYDLCTLKLAPSSYAQSEHIAAGSRFLRVDRALRFGAWRLARFEPQAIPDTHVAG